MRLSHFNSDSKNNFRFIFFNSPTSQHDAMSEFAKDSPADFDFSNFEFEIKADDNLSKNLLKILKTQGKENQAKRLLEKMSNHMNADDQKGFDVDRVFPGDKFDFTKDSITVSRKGKEIAKITLSLNAEKVDVKDEFRKNLGKVTKEIVQANFENIVKKRNLVNLRRLIGLNINLKSRKEDWKKLGGGLESNLKSPQDWIKDNWSDLKQRNIVTSDFQKDYKGTSDQNCAYCEYYLALKKNKPIKSEKAKRIEKYSKILNYENFIKNLSKTKYLINNKIYILTKDFEIKNKVGKTVARVKKESLKKFFEDNSDEILLIKQKVQESLININNEKNDELVTKTFKDELHKPNSGMKNRQFVEVKDSKEEKTPFNFEAFKKSDTGTAFLEVVKKTNDSIINWKTLEQYSGYWEKIDFISITDAEQIKEIEETLTHLAQNSKKKDGEINIYGRIFFISSFSTLSKKDDIPNIKKRRLDLFEKIYDSNNNENIKQTIISELSEIGATFEQAKPFLDQAIKDSGGKLSIISNLDKICTTLNQANPYLKIGIESSDEYIKKFAFNKLCDFLDIDSNIAELPSYVDKNNVNSEFSNFIRNKELYETYFSSINYLNKNQFNQFLINVDKQKNANEQILSILSDIAGYCKYKPTIILKAKLNPSKFLAKDAPELFKKATQNWEHIWDIKDPEKKQQLITSIDNAIKSIEDLNNNDLSVKTKKFRDFSEADQQKIQDLYPNHIDLDFTKKLRYFTNENGNLDEKREKWSGIQKFCYRQEQRVAGAKDFLLEQLKAYKNKLKQVT